MNISFLKQKNGKHIFDRREDQDSACCYCSSASSGQHISGKNWFGLKKNLHSELGNVNLKWAWQVSFFGKVAAKLRLVTRNLFR